MKSSLSALLTCHPYIWYTAGKLMLVMKNALDLSFFESYSNDWLPNEDCFKKYCNKYSCIILMLLTLTVSSCEQVIEDEPAGTLEKLSSVNPTSNCTSRDVLEMSEKKFHEVVAEPMTSDFLEASLIRAIRNDEINLAINLAKRLASLGCPKFYFEKNYELDGEEWSAFLLGFDTIPKSYNYEARIAFEKIFYRDQMICSTYSNANLHPFYLTIGKDFITLIKKFGFPSERLVGVTVTNEGAIASPWYDVIMLHHYHKGELLLWNELDSLVNHNLLDCRLAENYKQFEGNAAIAEEMNMRRNPPQVKAVITPVTIFTDNSKPICEDTYMFVKEQRNQVVVNYDQDFSLAYLDWNGDSLFREREVDYFALIYPDSSLSCYSLINTEDTIIINDRAFIVDHLRRNVTPVKLDLEPQNNSMYTTFTTKLQTIPLAGGGTHSIKNKLLDTTIIYFYATWCRPCIDKLIQVNKSSCNLKYNFVPVALESSEGSVESLFRRNDLNFPMLIGDKILKERESINSFPTAIFLNKSGDFFKKTNSIKLYDILKDGS